ncbi:molybdopterin-dependent oxidoreductase [Ruegeria sp. Ofav3-42]|uniref:molybdopterin-dependent oxidoreductase n=1 Tax=Ruegeria sp. Ofav3-42 TaxID=2917759 RepID=UPI001EF6DDDC|nr:molybdopterin-dependent oxidoreductase [Ruegeria sp. Ofav3-42]MCG7522785.1 molybdopterin-dependent oxidoreductase [Ruegeria sp. Ofav3-42]
MVDRWLQNFITQDSELFVKDHLGEPASSVVDWRLEISGLVTKAHSFSLLDLRNFPQTELMGFHKCAGSPINPDRPTPHEVGNVVWKGVALRHLIEQCHVEQGASHVWMTGADHGSYRGTSPQYFSKDLPLSKAMSDEVIVATEMNHKPLTKTRGGPVRLIVPGYYATNSVKWLTSIQLQAGRSTSIFATKYYNDTLPTENGQERIVPVWGVKPDSVITSVSDNGILAGWCWGEIEIDTVEVSLDSGHSWLPATVSKRKHHSWQKFTAPLPRLTAGSYSAIARATDTSGELQPFSGGRNSMTVFQFHIPP